MVYLQTVKGSGFESKLSKSKYFFVSQGTTETCILVKWWKGNFPGSSCVFEGRLPLSSDPPSNLISLSSHDPTTQKRTSQPTMAFKNIISFIRRSILLYFVTPLALLEMFLRYKFEFIRWLSTLLPLMSESRFERSNMGWTDYIESDPSMV